MKHLLLLLSSCCIINLITDAQVRPTHTVIVIMENHSYNEIVGNASAPYINSLLANPYTATLTQSHGVTHPSQPNYLQLFSGSKQGVSDDYVPAASPFYTANVGAELRQANFTFTGYSESMPSVGYNGATSGTYARKHNPWVNWQGTGTNQIPSTSNQPFTSFPSNYDNLPTLSFVVPNQANDMHDGTVAAGDTWLSNNMNGYIQWCKTHNSLFILTFDEDDNSSSNQILTAFTGADILGGNNSQSVNHYNVLRTLEELYGLSYAGASSSSTSIKNIWRSSLPIKLVSFTATEKGSDNILSWSTMDEINTAYFELQRSHTGNNFVPIAKVTPTGNGTYRTTDSKPPFSLNYYRLKMADKDGSFTYSNVVAVQTKLTKGLTVYPNPACGAIHVMYTAHSTRRVVCTLINALGVTVYSGALKMNIGNNSFTINATHFVKGNYFLRLKSDDDDKTEKVVLR